MLRALAKAEKFWEEAISRVPDQKKLISFIEEINELYLKICCRYREYCELAQQCLPVDSSDYDKNWHKRVKTLVDTIYLPFENALINKRFKLDP